MKNPQIGMILKLSIPDRLKIVEIDEYSNFVIVKSLDGLYIQQFSFEAIEDWFEEIK